MDNKSILLGLVVLTLSCIYLFYLNHTKYQELDELSNEVNKLKLLNNLTQTKLLEMIDKDKSLVSNNVNENQQPLLNNNVTPLTKENIETFENINNSNNENLELSNDDIHNIDNLNVIEINEEMSDENEEVNEEEVEQVEQVEQVEEETHSNSNELEELDVEELVIEPNEVLVSESNDLNGELNLDDLGDEGSELNLNFDNIEEVNNALPEGEILDNNEQINEETIEEDNQLNINNVDSMTIKELKVVAKNMNLKIKGNKEEIINRIKDNINKNM